MSVRALVAKLLSSIANPNQAHEKLIVWRYQFRVDYLRLHEERTALETADAWRILAAMGPAATAELRFDTETADRWLSKATGLTVLETYVLQQRGYIGSLCWPLEEIAVLLGITGERARQLERQALARLAKDQRIQALS